MGYLRQTNMYKHTTNSGPLKSGWNRKKWVATSHNSISLCCTPHNFFVNKSNLHYCCSKIHCASVFRGAFCVQTWRMRRWISDLPLWCISARDRHKKKKKKEEKITVVQYSWMVLTKKIVILDIAQVEMYIFAHIEFF